MASHAISAHSQQWFQNFFNLISLFNLTKKKLRIINDNIAITKDNFPFSTKNFLFSTLRLVR